MSPDLNTAAPKLPSTRKRFTLMVTMALSAIGLIILLAVIWWPAPPGGGSWSGSEEAKITYREQASKVPDAFPADIPQMPGAEIGSTLIKDDLGRRNYWISWTTGDSLEAVVKFFEGSLRDTYRVTDSGYNRDGTWSISFEAVDDPDRNGRGFIDIWTEADGSTTFTVSLDKPTP